MLEDAPDALDSVGVGIFSQLSAAVKTKVGWKISRRARRFCRRI